MSLATLRHRTSSGDAPAGCWEYDPARQVIEARVVLGYQHFDVTVEICTHRHPKPFAFVMVRTGGDTFRLTNGRWPSDPRRDIAKAERLHPGMPLGSIDLTHAPADVAREIEALL